MIYLDTSVMLAELLSEDRRPRRSLWNESLVSSRLLEYELWTRLHAYGFATSHGDVARALLSRVSFLEMTPDVLARALSPFPVQVRTLDALHLASMVFLVENHQRVVLASFDERMRAAAERLRIPRARI